MKLKRMLTATLAALVMALGMTVPHTAPQAEAAYRYQPQSCSVSQRGSATVSGGGAGNVLIYVAYRNPKCGAGSLEYWYGLSWTRTGLGALGSGPLVKTVAAGKIVIFTVVQNHKSDMRLAGGIRWVS